MGGWGHDVTDRLGTHTYLYVSVPFMRVVVYAFGLQWGGVSVRQASQRGPGGPVYNRGKGLGLLGSWWGTSGFHYMVRGVPKA